MEIDKMFNKDSKLLAEIREISGAIVPEGYMEQQLEDYKDSDNVIDLDLGKKTLDAIIQIYINFQNNIEDNFYISLGQIEYLVTNSDIIKDMLTKEAVEESLNLKDNEGNKIQKSVAWCFNNLSEDSQKNKAIGNALAIITDIIEYVGK